jgi:thiol-disulfide isomerase/thioredoxin
MCVRRHLWFLLLSAVSLSFAADKPEPAPHFNAKTLSGDTFNNASIKGKVVLLQFWATWCPYCRGEQQIVDDLQKEFADRDLIVLAVDSRGVRIMLTEDTNFAAMYAATRYPIYVVIDRDGNIAGQQNGAAGERAQRRLLARAGLESQVSQSED